MTTPESDIVERLRNKDWLWSVPGALREEAANEIENLRRNLNGRDDFIGKIGQWDAFVAQLPK
jgi:hypothetical protein